MLAERLTWPRQSGDLLSSASCLMILNGQVSDALRPSFFAVCTHAAMYVDAMLFIVLAVVSYTLFRDDFFPCTHAHQMA